MGRWDNKIWERKIYPDKWHPTAVNIPGYELELEDEDSTVELIYVFLDDVPDEYFSQFKSWLQKGGYANNAFPVKYRKKVVVKDNIDEEYTWEGTRIENWRDWYLWLIGETDKKPKPAPRKI